MPTQILGHSHTSLVCTSGGGYGGRVALGERGRNPLLPRSTAEGAASFRAAGALETDPAVRCPDAMAAGFLGGVNVTTLAKHRLTRRLYVRLVDRLLPGAYPYEIAR